MSDIAVSQDTPRRGRPPNVRPDIELVQSRRPVFSWLPMDDAPKDGKWVYLTPDLGPFNSETTTEAIWRNTRRFDVIAQRFVPHGYWGYRLGIGHIPWEPKGWYWRND